ncbi:MAG: trypsin-like peptidase domain-containing protein [Limisphaerales bacterium]
MNTSEKQLSLCFRLDLPNGRPDGDAKLQPDLMCALAAKGADIMDFGIRDFEPWSAKLLANFGGEIADKLRVHLCQIYNAAQEEVRKRQGRLQTAERAPVLPAPSVGTQADGDTGQARPVAVAKPATEAPLICTQTNSQPCEEPPRQIPAPMGPRPKWRTRRLAIGTAAALAIIAGLVAVRMWRGGAQPNKLRGLDPDEFSLDDFKPVKDGAQPNKPRAVDPLEDLRARAEKGSAAAQYDLGSRYYDGRGIQQNYSEAVKWYRKSADQGVTLAQYYLGHCYKDGKGVQRDYAEAAKWFRKAADHGNVSARFFFDLAYKLGPGGLKDEAEAVGCYRKAADQGDAAAQYNLGWCYNFGQSVQQNDVEAIKWWRKAADQGHAEAQDLLGDSYDLGRGVQQDHAEAAKWYRRAADQGNANAQSSLGSCYSVGKGVQKSDAEAAKWFRKAAEQGDAGAQTGLAFYYDDGDGVEQNYTEAIKWWRKAADQGDRLAQGMLDIASERGPYGLQYNEEAIKWYRKAAEQGDATAQYNLGVYYAKGQGVGLDYAEAVKWYRKAAEQGDADAQGSLGYYYDSGKGVQQDHAEAAKWYRKAAEQGDSCGQWSLGSCYESGQGVPQDYAEAAKWYRHAADQGNYAAQYCLGWCYKTGEGVPQNDIEAYKWFSLAAAAGHKPSAELRDKVSERMARAEVVEAQRRASVFVAKKEGGGGGVGHISPTPEIAEGKGCLGTGFFVTEDGYFVTCEHVVRGATSFHVRSPSGSLPARLIKKDRTIDVAVLRVDGAFRALPVAAQPRVKLGEAVFTVGFPNPVVQGVEPKLTRGEISSMAGIRDNPRYYQISVPVQPGNSGGALLDECGNAVGVVTSRLDDVATYQESGALPQNVNYAVKGGLVYSFLSGVPELSGKLKAPGTARDREAASGAAERAAVLVVAE